LFKQQTGVEIVHVPFKGMGPAMPDVVAGRVQVMMTGYPAIASYVDGGKIRILASAGAERSKLQPSISTLREQGIPNVESGSYFSLFAPRGTPGAVVTRLNTEANKVLATAQVRDDLAKRGVIAAGGTPEQLQQKLKAQVDKWTVVVKKAGVKGEE
jgi:tripartite-type tricarboxylate transporter receptor subunit TctC